VFLDKKEEQMYRFEIKTEYQILSFHDVMSLMF